MSNPKKHKLPLPPAMPSWVVYSSKGHMYAASNHYTKALAIERHCSDLGLPWREAKERGDRLIRVTIQPIRES